MNYFFLSRYPIYHISYLSLCLSNIKSKTMLSRIIVLVIAGVAVVYIVRFIDNFLSQHRRKY
ncbi:hypothetical protein GAO43_05020 [Bacteroides thetaiotaomicron]|uniref:Uncharacterized protein n=5 Tax=Bacteroides TaxID=816 RepID=Q8A9Q3_BACTN|nr:hypothetical protein BT_0762 [Bacteroides thetaiotaomicron VPI-5482]KAB4263689.1 hypothetical protein GAO47_24205 [Bacteroides thetaiotaomicron]KAB4270493.1 hypothetical protein GAO40_19690 [Bacteroides thetaiotaomicron]KAB4277544.1 hypothetical protein GAO45_24580 [Bacteroides thetaiotaomicron]KAB4281324.1 hypothetical protein GAO35_07090 [Bacteroides thetaiotaomicron]